MTYLDPDRMHHGPNAGRIVLRILIVLAVVAFGWFALTVGNQDGTGRPEIVQEPVADAV